MGKTGEALRLAFGKGFWLKFPKAFALEIGHEEGFFLSDIIEKSDCFDRDPDGWFFYTAERAERETGFSYQRQHRMVRALEGLGFIETTRRGVPPLRFFRVNLDRVHEIMLEFAEKKKAKSRLPNLSELKHLNISAATDSSSKTLEENKTLKHSPSGNVHNPSGYGHTLSGNGAASGCAPRRRFLGVQGATEPTPETKAHDNPLLRIPRHCMEILELWNTLPGLSRVKIPRETDPATGAFLNPTKTLTESVGRLRELLRGTAFRAVPGLTGLDRRFTLEEVKRAVYNFHLAAGSPDYQPVNKGHLRHVSPKAFVYDEWRGNGKDGERGRSLFLKYVDEPPKTVREMVRPAKELNPFWTERLIEAYYGRFHSGVVPRRMPQAERNKFVRGANLLKAKAGELAKRTGTAISVPEWCDYVVRAIARAFRDPRPGNVASDHTYDYLLPEFLLETGRVEREDRGGPARRSAGDRR